MKNFLYSLTSLALTAALTVSLPSQAADVETQQYNVNAAQSVLDDAKANLDVADEHVKRQNQRIAQEQTVLKDLQKKQDAAKANYDKAKTQLDIHQKVLDAAWKKK